MKPRDIFIGVFLLALLAGLGWVWLMPAGLQRAPALQLSTLDGRSLTLAEMHGRPLLVTFWATTCPSCLKEMPHLVELYQELSPRGLQIIGIAMNYDPLPDVVALTARRQVPYIIAHDTNAQAARVFGDVRLTPTTFLIAPDGRIVQQTIGEMDMAALRSKIVAMLGQPKTL
jgi:thiol-disulfide isomerase/thioredoxin